MSRVAHTLFPLVSQTGRGTLSKLNEQIQNPLIVNCTIAEIKRRIILFKTLCYFQVPVLSFRFGDLREEAVCSENGTGLFSVLALL